MLSRRQLANAIRVLSMDAIERAGSGHPGMPMGMADIAEVLWRDFLVHNPNNPQWVNRDRFVMSNGHGAMLLYAVLHLCGYALSLDQIKKFRQLHSNTPGHPEYNDTPGVEATTGPLGQGLANAVGMAMAERTLAAHFNRDGFNIVDHHTYFFAGDGCLMEGISHEACSLAGTQRLGKLIGIFDNNQISIDGDVRGWFTDDTVQRFQAYGWHVVNDVDGHMPEQINAAIKAATAETERPSLICCKTVIGWGAPEKQGTAACHGAPLGTAEIARARAQLAWEEEPFVIPDAYYTAWDARVRGQQLEQKWQALFVEYSAAYPQLADEFSRRMQKRLPQTWQATVSRYLKKTILDAKSVATRKASQAALCAYAPVLPELIGGSADLTSSNLTQWDGSVPLSAQHPNGNYIYYGVREFAMAAINNGIALYGGLIPYAGTFLMFSDYARNALRMAALMRLRSIFVLTHDSIGLGEDGPTHQAIEQAASLRLIPNMSVWRPCDAVESAVAWQAAIEHTNGPTALLLSRQSLPHIQHDEAQCTHISKGGYILLDSAQPAELIIIATGSEVSLAYTVGLQLIQQGKHVRVVSMPSTNVFDTQTQQYRDTVLNPACRKRIAIEAGVCDFWCKYVGFEGRVIGIDTFGKSAPADALYRYFDITEERLMAAALALLRQDIAH